MLLFPMPLGRNHTLLLKIALMKSASSFVGARAIAYGQYSAAAASLPLWYIPGIWLEPLVSVIHLIIRSIILLISAKRRSQKSEVRAVYRIYDDVV